ncbi:MAG: hypothetical protein C4519_19795 [Desulfobacteraceae bacterium]|nr:MAG: hypothetical protein C4519_19795 [Desulfobacteraceae bacterium]
MKDRFLIGEVIRVLGIPRERLKEWQLRGFITPSIQSQQGARVLHSYTFFDMVVIKTFDQLITRGLNRKWASWCVMNMYDFEKELLSDDTRFMVFYNYPESATARPPFSIISKELTKKSFYELFMQDVIQWEEETFDDALILNFDRIRRFVHERAVMIG